MPTKPSIYISLKRQFGIPVAWTTLVLTATGSTYLLFEPTILWLLGGAMVACMVGALTWDSRLDALITTELERLGFQNFYLSDGVHNFDDIYIIDSWTDKRINTLQSAGGGHYTLESSRLTPPLP